ncbi:MAG: hypothetical protein Kow00129_06230 [Thermoleophilia bacterium]
MMGIYAPEKNKDSEGYRPDRVEPGEARHARTLILYSLAAGALVLGILLLTQFTGLAGPRPDRPLVAISLLLAILVPLAVWEYFGRSGWTSVRDRYVASAVLGLDLLAGTAVVYLTGGPESIFVILIPIAPFALRLLADLAYAVAYAMCVALGLAGIIGLRLAGIDHPQSPLSGATASHTELEVVLALTTVGAVIASSLLADRIARFLSQKEEEALAFSAKMNARAEKLSLLFKVGTALSRGSNFEEVAHKSLTSVHEYFRAEATVLYLLDPLTGKLKPITALGEEAKREADESTLALATIGTGTARLWPATVEGEEGRRSAMVAPLTTENRAHGAIKVVARQGQPLNRSKLALLETVANELAVTLRAADDFRTASSELTAVSSELSALTAYTRKVSSTTDAETMADDLLNAALKYTASDYGNVTLAADADEERYVTRFANYPPEVETRLRRTKWRAAGGVYGQALRTGSTIVVNDVNESPEYRAVLPDVRSKISVPILVEDAVDGMINLESRRPNHFTKSDVDFLVALAEATGIALRNSRLYLRCRDMAVRDGLTGLYDRGYLEQALEAEVSRSRRHERCFSLLFLDVDDFKDYNDKYGHPAGDEVMRWLSRVLKNSIRRSDVAARYGGEEFVVIMPETDRLEAAEAAEKLRSLIDRRQPDSWPRRVTVTIGVAEFPTDGEDATILLDTADRRLYAGKREGKNQVVSYDRFEEVPAASPARSSLISP